MMMCYLQQSCSLSHSHHHHLFVHLFHPHLRDHHHYAPHHLIPQSVIRYTNKYGQNTLVSSLESSVFPLINDNNSTYDYRVTVGIKQKYWQQQQQNRR